MKTMSVRGTITSRTIVSPSSNTEWIISRSPDSMTPAGLGQVDQLAQLGLGGERSFAEALAGRERVADQDQQPRQRAEHPRERAAAAPARPSAIGSACWRPRVRGRDADHARTDTTSIDADGDEHRLPGRVDRRRADDA